MKKTIVSLFLVALIAAPLAAFSDVASVRAASINTAIRGTTNATVYWYANDGKRYVFPNAATYYTWFTSFSNVQTISDSELFSIQLGGNVTYRPGAKLVKVTTDPKVYAVARGGILRHVTSESLAIQLYGFNWASKVQDVPDEFFTNYTVGSPIYSTSDYNVSNEYNGVFSPSDSLRTQGQNNNNQSGSLTLTADRTSITSGQAVYLTGSYFGTLPSGGYLEIKDVRTSNTLKTCYNTSTCNVTVYPTVDSSQNSVQYYIVAKNSNGTFIANQYGPVIYMNGYNQNGSLTMNADRTSITSGQAVYLTSDYNANIPSGGRIEIKEVRNNNVVKTCYNSSSCNVTVYPYQTGYSSTQYVANVIDNNGNTIATQYGQTIYFDGSNGQNGSLTITSDRTNITSGQAVTLNANYNNSLNGGRIEIREIRTNNIVKTCYDTSYCSVTVYLYQNGYTSTQYIATVFNNSGSQIATQYSSTIYFDGSNNQNGTLTLNADRTSITSGQAVMLSTSYNYSLNGGRVEIKEIRTGNIVKTCYDNSYCSVTVYPYQNGYTSTQYVATVFNSSDSQIATQYSATIYFNDNGNGSSNDGTNYINGLTLQSDRTSITNGGMVKLTANAYNAGNWSYIGNRIEIRDIRTGSIVRTCYDQSWCVADVSVTGNNGTAQYEARIYDRNNNFVMSQFGPVIYVSGTTSTGSTGTGSTAQIPNTDIYIAPSTNVRPGNTVYLTASFTNLPYTSTDTVIRIYTERSSTPVGTCSASVSCSVPYTISNSGVNTRVYGVASNSSLSNTRETAHIPLVTF
jgi:polyisoprenoid-binding protein YceI